MRKLNYAVAVVLAAMVSFAACKKDDGTEETELTGDGVIKTPTGKTCQLTSVDGGDELTMIEYDEQGRIKKVIYQEDGDEEGYTTYTYSNNQIIVRDYEDNTLEYTKTYTLSNGRVASSTETYTENHGDNFTYTTNVSETYEHNTEGYVTKVTSTIATTSNNPDYPGSNRTEVEVYIYQNGNLVSETETVTYNGGPGTPTQSYSYTTTYEYYLDKANTLFDEDFFITKPNKNLVKKVTETSSGSTSSFIEEYTYEFNSDGLVTKSTETEVGVQNPDIDITTYSYNCK